MRGPRRPEIRFLQVSTDEVYGAVEDGFSVETDQMSPRSPYAAAKAAGELLAHAYRVTHGVDVVVTRGGNTYGPFQHPEKLIPLFITNALSDRPLPLYGDGMQQRDWLTSTTTPTASGSCSTTECRVRPTTSAAVSRE